MVDGQTKKPSLGVALLTIIVPLLIVLWGGIILRIGFLIPLALAATVAGIFSLIIGFSWAEIQKGMFKAMDRVSIAVLIMLCVGMLIGVWIKSGTIPLLIYWGLKILTPSTFLIGTFIVCAVFSVATGTSFGTIGTAGLALLGVGQAMGFPAGLTAGAIVSGAYFGDKMSPVSDTTNVASATTETNIFSHIASMFYTTIPASVVAIIIYGILGTKYSGSIPDNIGTILATLESNFNLTILVLIPPIVLAVLAIKRFPAIPTLIVSIVLGAIFAVIFQGAAIKDILLSATSGFKYQTGVSLIDGILSRGGIESMFSSVVMLIIAVALGGILESSGSLEVVIDAVLKRVRSTGGLILSVLVSCYLLIIGTGNVMVGIIVPGLAFNKVFKEKGIQSRVLSRTLEDSATIGAPLIPWSLAAIFTLGVLKVPAGEYAPYALLCWIVPIFSIIYGFTGFAIFKEDSSNSGPSTDTGVKA